LVKQFIKSAFQEVAVSSRKMREERKRITYVREHEDQMKNIATESDKMRDDIISFRLLII
jgi:hypothetical protein